jgi:hypothetical protein
MCFVIPFFCLVLSIFQQSYPISPMKAGIEWCAALLWFLSLCWSWYFNSPTQFLPIKQGLSDVLLFWFLSLRLVLRVFFNSPVSTYEAGIEWCAALLWFLSLCLVLRVFSTVLPNFLWKQGLSDVLLFLIPFFVFGLRVFSTVLQFLPESRSWVMCSLWFLSLCLVLRVFFNSPTQFLPESRRLSDVLPFWFFLCVWS